MTPQRKAKFERVAWWRQTNLTVVLENVHDPHNIGAVLRSCDAVGIGQLYLLYTVPELTPPEINIGHSTSSGARKWVDVFLFQDAAACFAHIRNRYQIILGTHLSAEAKTLYELDLTQSMALVFGNERDGLTEEALQHCDGNFHIPMMGMVQSLNISVACAVTLFEALRQRQNNHQYDSQPVISPTEQKALLEEYTRRHETGWKGKKVIRL